MRQVLTCFTKCHRRGEAQGSFDPYLVSRCYQLVECVCAPKALRVPGVPAPAGKSEGLDVLMGTNNPSEEHGTHREEGSQVCYALKTTWFHNFSISVL